VSASSHARTWGVRSLVPCCAYAWSSFVLRLKLFSHSTLTLPHHRATFSPSCHATPSLSLTCVRSTSPGSSSSTHVGEDESSARLNRQRSKARVARIGATPEQQDLQDRVDLTKLLKKTQNELLELRITFEAEKQKSTLLRSQCRALNNTVEQQQLELQDLRSEVAVYKEGLADEHANFPRWQCPVFEDELDQEPAHAEVEEQADDQENAKEDEQEKAAKQENADEREHEKAADGPIYGDSNAGEPETADRESASGDTPTTQPESAPVHNMVERLQQAGELLRRIRVNDERLCERLRGTPANATDTSDTSSTRSSTSASCAKGSASMAPLAPAPAVLATHQLVLQKSP
jgi:hypothetical protein